MERLTIKNTDGGVTLAPWATSADVKHRLAAYEDTGLTPEEIRQMAWRPGTELPEDERQVIVQYHFGEHVEAEFTSVLSYLIFEKELHWKREWTGLTVDRWMEIPPVKGEVK